MKNIFIYYINKMVKSEERNFTDMLTPQAKLLTLGFVLIYIASIITIIMTKMYKNVTSVGVVSVIINILLTILSIYVINCTVTGNCNFYAWFMAYLMVAIGIVVVISSFVMISKN